VGGVGCIDVSKIVDAADTRSGVGMNYLIELADPQCGVSIVLKSSKLNKGN